MTIGTFAQRSGLTASALRFYADAGLLPPAEVDAVSGYRFYDEAQIERAVLVRRLREIGMPLEAVRSALGADPEVAVRLVDAHLDRIVSDIALARERAAEAVKADLSGAPSLPVASLSGPVLAAAIDQILAATTSAPGVVALDGVRFEFGPDAVVLTATDRYRLATRTIIAAAASVTWAATIDADDLREHLDRLRRSPHVALAASNHGVVFRCREDQERHCRILTDPYPDFRGMIDRLPEARTRVVVDKRSLLRAMESISADFLLIDVDSSELAMRPAPGPGGPEARIPAAVMGPGMEIGFLMTTLYPAVSSAIGADLLIDLRGPQTPATIRSADDGDLTTLAMPATPSPQGALR